VEAAVSGRPGVALYRYEAGHAFSNWDAQSLYNKEAANLAWERTLNSSSSISSHDSVRFPYSLAPWIGEPQSSARALRRYSLIKTAKEGLVVHRLVQTAIRNTLSPDQQQWGVCQVNGVTG
jgi:hypothetical protein